MLILKKIDLFILRHFLGVFFMTFTIVIFVLLMQSLWMHVNDLVGKGVEIKVLAEFFLYASVSVIPLALPLALLFASLMTFGNMGEKYELTAMKAAGISLFRIMQPLTIMVSIISLSALLFSNYVVPKAETKLWTLIFSLRQKSPEFDIPTGEFYDGIKGYNLYVRSKDPQRKLLKDLMIYDFSAGFANATVMMADSGRVFFTNDNKYLLFELYSGESFENLKKQRIGNTAEQTPYRRETFSTKKILIDFDSEFNRYDESLLKDMHVSKNLVQLSASIDSMQVEADNRTSEQSREMVAQKYFGREQHRSKVLEPLGAEEVGLYRIDSLYAHFDERERQRALQQAVEKAKGMRDQVTYNRIMLNDALIYVRRHLAQFHRKFTLSFACLVFFFIGAPFGAITRKGGLGAPVVISVVMFVIYYIIDNAGFKMGREGLWEMYQGIWLSTAVLLPIGIFLIYKAATDAALFNPESWTKNLARLMAKARAIRKYFKRVR